MNNVVALFLERLAERLTALVAGLVSSRVEGLHAAVQAEQQSQLEDLARKYELEGKPEIAATLRERSLRLSSPNLAATAVDSVQQLVAEPLKLPGSVTSAPSGELTGLPDFASTPRHRSRKARAETSESLIELPGEGL